MTWRRAYIIPFLDQCGIDDPRPRPSTRQLKYVLWLWRNKSLQGTVLVRWEVISCKASISLFIDERRGGMFQEAAFVGKKGIA